MNESQNEPQDDRSALADRLVEFLACLVFALALISLSMGAP